MNQVPSPLDRYAPPPLPQNSSTEHPIAVAVLSGKRFVMYPFVLSMLILTFRRHIGGVREVSNGNWPMGSLFAAAIVTVGFGWWGFPWGLIWTPVALVALWNGGKDLTKDILTNAVGAPDAQRILAAAPKPKPPGSIWLVRLLILAPVLLVGSLILAAVLAPEV